MAKSKEKKKDAPPPQEKVEAVPEFRDDQGNLFKLKRSDFPGGKTGNVAWCKYQLERWQEKLERSEKGADPRQKKLDKLARLEAQMEALKAELEQQ